MIRKPVEGDLEAFEQFIRQKFTADGTLLSEMLDYALSARGKPPFFFMAPTDAIPAIEVPIQLAKHERPTISATPR